MQSLVLLQAKWPQAQLQPEDLVTLSAAEKSFMRLLAQAQEPAHLQALGQLLLTIWQPSTAFSATEVFQTSTPFSMVLASGLEELVHLCK